MEDGCPIMRRYADDMVFGFPKGVGSWVQIYKQCFAQALKKLKLSSKSVEIVREKNPKAGQEGKLQVLALIFTAD